MLSDVIGSVELSGRRFKFVAVDALGVREGFEEWMLDEAYRRHWAMKKHVKTKANPTGFLSDEEWEEDRDRLRRDATSFAYSWGTEAWARAYNSLPGRKKLLSLMLEIADPTYDRAVIDDLYDPRKTSKEVRRAKEAEMLDFGLSPNSDGAETSKGSGSPSAPKT